MDSGVHSPSCPGFLDLPWELMEHIILQNSLSFRDMVSTIRVLAPNDQTVKCFVASANYSETLWEKKFRRLYPDLYRIFVQYPTNKFCRKIDWYSLLQTRYEIGKEIGPVLRAMRTDAMYSYLETAGHQQDRLITHWLDSDPGDIRYPRSERETRSPNAGVLNTALDYNFHKVSSVPEDVDQCKICTECHYGPAAVVTSFVMQMSGALNTDNSETFRLQKCGQVQHRMTELLLRSGKITNPYWLGENGDHIVTSTVAAGWLILDACRENIENLTISEKKTNLAHTGTINHGVQLMRMCQTKVSTMEICSGFLSVLSQIASDDLHAFGGTCDEFFVCLNFLQACYPLCSDVVGKFYSNVWKAASRVRKLMAQRKHYPVQGMDFIQLVISWISQAVQEMGTDLLPDELAIASGAICNFPYTAVVETCPSILTFTFLAKCFLARDNIAVTLRKLWLNIAATNPEGSQDTYRNKIYIVLPCFTVEGRDHLCLPYRQNGRFPEIFCDYAVLAAALHKNLFDGIYESFGTVRELRIASLASTGLVDHLHDYLTSDFHQPDTCIARAVAKRSESYGGIFVKDQRALFGEISPSNFGFFADYCRMQATTDTNAHSERPVRNSPATYESECTLPVGTVVSMKYRSFILDIEDDSVDHLAVIVNWKSSRKAGVSDEGGAQRIRYCLLCLDSPHENDPYVPPACAKLAAKMTVVDNIPIQVQAHLHTNIVLWAFFNSFDGMFLVPQPALKEMYPDDYKKQDVIRALAGHTARDRVM
ncbi:uncharacterized protein LOC129597134 [Paramacrobiotus metropolitanus]|uniref:uncharacterized protein LOC129597134 n=1 Tax=Paramacrobiotus metropolitanus TaxID=2943436 RepID=UPI00244612E9|nr:uncharacterized protein LOC129597134 [Paramacrobiotus metropolitanus]